MNVFSGNFGAKVKAVYVEQNRKGVLGNIAGAEHDVTILATEAFTNAWQSETIAQTSDVLVYGYPGSVLADETCQGGTIKFKGREFRIDSFALAVRQLDGKVMHSELGCSRI